MKNKITFPPSHAAAKAFRAFELQTKLEFIKSELERVQKQIKNGEIEFVESVPPVLKYVVRDIQEVQKMVAENKWALVK
jgi:hypothetical protein